MRLTLHDLADDLVREMGELIAEPDLDGEELGYIVLGLGALVGAGVVAEACADDLLAARRGDRP
jgi:hypothetical protein